MRSSVTVARLALNQLVKVQILAPQLSFLLKNAEKQQQEGSDGNGTVADDERDGQGFAWQVKEQEHCGSAKRREDEAAKGNERRGR